MYAILFLVAGANPAAALALAQAHTVVISEPAAIWAPDPRYSHWNRWSGGQIVGSWFPTEDVYRTYDMQTGSWGPADRRGPRPPSPRPIADRILQRPVVVQSAPVFVAPAPIRMRQVCGPNGCQMVPW